MHPNAAPSYGGEESLKGAAAAAAAADADDDDDDDQAILRGFGQKVFWFMHEFPSRAGHLGYFFH